MQLKVFAPAIIITLAGFLIAWQFVNPAPPRTITIAAGNPGGAYHLFAERYQPLLAAEGITLNILDTAGSVENIRLLEGEASSIDLAFIQGGSTAGPRTGDLNSLGSLYFEPLWVFYRGDTRLERLTDLHGRRVAIGEPGSGTRALAVTLLADNAIDTGAGKIFPVGDQAAVDALLAGTVDAAFFVASAQSPLVQSLLHHQDIRLMSFSRAAAYAQLHPFLSSITLPQGIIDLQANIPPEDITLLAPTANLAARDNFHPALVSLLLQTAAQVHSSGSLFARPGEFPNDRNLVFRLNDDARRYYRHGAPFLQRYLPFWTASLIDRLKIMLLPLLTLLIPLAKIMPPTYRWRTRKKIYRWYRELKALDTEHPEQSSAEDLRFSIQQLAVLEEEVRKVKVPLSYSDELYTLRLHIGLVRNRLTDAL